MAELPQSPQMLRQREIYRPHHHDIWKERVVFERSQGYPYNYLLDGDQHQSTRTRFHRVQHQQTEPCIGKSGNVIPPGYYEALDDDGEYHLYPVLEEDGETQQQFNQQVGLAIQALFLLQLGSLKLASGGTKKNAETSAANQLTSPVVTWKHTIHHPTVSYILDEDSTEELGMLDHDESMRGGARMVIEPDSLIKATTSTIQASRPLVVCLDLCDSGVSSESEIGSDTEENTSKKGKIQINTHEIKDAPKLHNTQVSNICVNTLGNKETGNQSKKIIQFNNSKNISPVFALGPRLNSIENSLKDSLSDFPNDLSNNGCVLPIETKEHRLLTVRVEESVLYQAQQNSQTALTAGKETVLGKNNQPTGPEVEPTFRSPNNVGNEFSWLKRFTSLIWNNTQEGIPVAVEPYLSGTRQLLISRATENSQKNARNSSVKLPNVGELEGNNGLENLQEANKYWDADNNIDLTLEDVIISKKEAQRTQIPFSENKSLLPITSRNPRFNGVANYSEDTSKDILHNSSKVHSIFKKTVNKHQLLLKSTNDCEPRRYMKTHQGPWQKLLRWKYRFADSVYDFKYRASSLNVNANALSRNPLEAEAQIPMKQNASAPVRPRTETLGEESSKRRRGRPRKENQETTPPQKGIASNSKEKPQTQGVYRCTRSKTIQQRQLLTPVPSTSRRSEGLNQSRPLAGSYANITSLVHSGSRQKVLTKRAKKNVDAARAASTPRTTKPPESTADESSFSDAAEIAGATDYSRPSSPEGAPPIPNFKYRRKVLERGFESRVMPLTTVTTNFRRGAH